jgi:hypothetical protein
MPVVFPHTTSFASDAAIAAVACVLKLGDETGKTMAKNPTFEMLTAQAQECR